MAAKLSVFWSVCLLGFGNLYTSSWASVHVELKTDSESRGAVISPELYGHDLEFTRRKGN